MENKKGLFVVLYVVGFIISGISFTMLMLTISHDPLSRALSIGMAIIFKFGEGLAFLNFFNGKLKSSIRGSLLTIWIVLLISSIFASQARLINETNKSQNEALKSSTAFKFNQEKQNINKGLLESKKAEIEALKAEKQKVITDMEKIRDSYPKNYITYKENLSKDIVNKANSYQGKIDQKSKELDTIAVNLSSTLDISNIKYDAADVDGYTAVLKIIAGWIKTDTDTVKFWFFFILTVVFELLICLLYYLSVTGGFDTETPKLRPTSPDEGPKKHKKDYNLSENQSPKNLSGKLSEVPVSSKLRRFTVVKSKNKSKKSKADVAFDNAVRAYIKAMDDTQKNDICVGYQKISKLAGLTDNQGKEVYGHLKKVGVLEVVGGQTRIIRHAKEA